MVIFMIENKTKQGEVRENTEKITTKELSNGYRDSNTVDRSI